MRGQVSIEYLILITLLMAILTPITYYALSTSKESIQISETESSLQSLAKAADRVYALGPGSKDYAYVIVPDSVESTTVGTDVLRIRTSVGTGTRDILATTQAPLIGSLPDTPGTHIVPVEMLASGVVRVGPMGLYAIPSTITLTAAPGTTEQVNLTILNENYPQATEMAYTASGDITPFTSIEGLPSQILPFNQANAIVVLTIPSNQPAGAYAGTLTIQSSLDAVEIPVTVNIPQVPTTLSITTTDSSYAIVKTNYFAGEPLYYKTELRDQSGELMSATLEHAVIDSQSTTFLNETDSQLEDGYYYHSKQIPFGAENGTWTIEATALNGYGSASASAQFTVEETTACIMATLTYAVEDNGDDDFAFLQYSDDAYAAITNVHSTYPDEPGLPDSYFAYFEKEGEMGVDMERLGADMYYSDAEPHISDLLTNLDKYDLILTEDAHLGASAVASFEQWVMDGGFLIASEHTLPSTAEMFGASYVKRGGSLGMSVITAEDEYFPFPTGSEFQPNEWPYVQDTGLGAIDFTVIARHSDSMPAIATWGYGNGTVYYFSDFDVDEEWFLPDAADGTAAILVDRFNNGSLHWVNLSFSVGASKNPTDVRFLAKHWETSDALMPRVYWNNGSDWASVCQLPALSPASKERFDECMIPGLDTVAEAGSIDISVVFDSAAQEKGEAYLDTAGILMCFGAALNDSIPPIITISSPDNATYNTTSVRANVSLNEAGSWCGYSLDGAANVTMSSSLPTHWNSQVSSLSNGPHTIVFHCNDPSGNMARAQRSFSVQAITALNIYRLLPQAMENDKNMKAAIVLYNPSGIDVKVSDVTEQWSIDKIVKDNNLVECSPECTPDEDAETITWPGTHTITAGNYSVFYYETKLDNPGNGVYANATASVAEGNNRTALNAFIKDHAATAYVTMSADSNTTYNAAVGPLAQDSAHTLYVRVEEVAGDNKLSAGQNVTVSVPLAWSNVSSNSTGVAVNGNTVVYTIQSGVKNSFEEFAFAAQSPDTAGMSVFNATITGTDEGGVAHNDVFEIVVTTGEEAGGYVLPGGIVSDFENISSESPAWQNQTGIGSFSQNTNPSFVNEGSGSMRVNYDFTAVPSTEKYVIKKNYLDANPDFSGYAGIRLDVYSDASNNSVTIAIDDVPENSYMWSARALDWSGYSTVTFSLAEAVADGVDLTQVQKVLIHLEESSTAAKKNSTVYYDDMRLVS
ncbi:MAG: hypothetical protein JW834_04970 [Candidatus Diapherotrites archaeon]|nr:hypothetical protein [Candidatus Diapherotrites archaeon]